MNRKKILIIILLLSVVSSLFFISKYNSAKATRLDDVILIEEQAENNNKMFAVNVEQADGTYKEQNGFPSEETHIFNEEKSECIDSDGQIIDGILSYKDGKVIVDVFQESYCYLYFGKKTFKGNALEMLEENKSVGGLGTTAYNGMYYYTGTNEIVNNYVSLGGVLYRIIGITSEANTTLGLEAGQFKLIKAESIETSYWDISTKSNIKWEASTMYTYLNNDVLNNKSYIPSNWSSRIDSVKWYIGDVNGTSDTYIGTGSAVFSYEDNTPTSSNSKIGLMYMSDYYYANTTGGTTNCYSACSNWMTLGSYEWTMTRYGNNGVGNHIVWLADKAGNVYTGWLYDTFVVRPVFYLNPNVVIISGNGTSSDPYILN